LERKEERRKEGKEERRKEGKKERRKEGKKERRKGGKERGSARQWLRQPVNFFRFPSQDGGALG
jgi:hypothetical protein